MSGQLIWLSRRFTVPASECHGQGSCCFLANGPMDIYHATQTPFEVHIGTDGRHMVKR